MQVIVGVDPHKASHTAVAIGDDERELGSVKVRATRRQVAQLLSWAEPFEKRTWAIESACGLGYLLSARWPAVRSHRRGGADGPVPHKQYGSSGARRVRRPSARAERQIARMALDVRCGRGSAGLGMVGICKTLAIRSFLNVSGVGAE